jgi:hypothetical protein
MFCRIADGRLSALQILCLLRDAGGRGIVKNRLDQGIARPNNLRNRRRFVGLRDLGLVLPDDPYRDCAWTGGVFSGDGYTEKNPGQANGRRSRHRIGLMSACGERPFPFYDYLGFTQIPDITGLPLTQCNRIFLSAAKNAAFFFICLFIEKSCCKITKKICICIIQLYFTRKNIHIFVGYRLKIDKEGSKLFYVSHCGTKWMTCD